MLRATAHSSQGNDIRNAFGEVADGHGVVIDGSSDNVIGGEDPSERNVLVGSGGGGGADCDNVQGVAGVAVLAGSADIRGNFIGTDGSGAIPNVVGVLVETDGVGINNNVISGNTCSGILVQGPSGGGDSGIRGNKIGTGQFGTDAVPNGKHGIEVLGGNVIIGGRRGEVCDDFCNVIAGNGGAGISFKSAHGLGNTIRNNQIYNHRGPGIDLSIGVGVDVRRTGNRLTSGDGHTENDADDLDDGPNGLQNTPDLLLAVRSGQSVEISGYVEVPDVIPGAYIIDIYANPACEKPGGFSEGQRPLVDTQTDASSISGSFGTSYFGLGNETTYLTATATHPDGSTSEFSQCLEVVDDDQVTEDDLEDDLFEGEGAQGEITSGHLAAKVQAEGTLLITRFMKTPPGSVFFGTSAQAPDGSALLPLGVAEGYWRLAGRGLVPSSDFAFNLCLNTTGLLAEEEVQETVLIHRNTFTGGAWIPYDTHLETINDAVYACADGLTGLGDFGFGLGTAAPFGEPTLTMPADGTRHVNERLDLRWETLTGAASYDLQVALLPTFVSPMVDTTGLAATSYVAGDLGGQTTHYWRVRGVDASGTVGPWSAPFTFSTGATGVDIEEEVLPEGFALLANYPNPFNPQTTIAFTLPQPSQVRLSVYDILGRQVAILRDGVFAAGRHEATFDAAGLPTGVYLYRLEAGTFVQTRRMLLLK